jgi:hypothetical protein
MSNEEEKIVLDKTKGNVLDVYPGCMAVELPAGYIYDGELHINAILREMKGPEEELLATRGPIVTRLNRIIGNCLVQLGSISDKNILRKAACEFIAQDRMAIFLTLRRVSLGDFYDCDVICPSCNTRQHVTINLSEIDISPMPNRMERDITSELTSGKIIKWHVISVDDEEWLTRQRKKEKDSNLMTLNLMSRIYSIDGNNLDRKNKYKESLGMLMDLSLRDRTELRTLFDKKEENIDTNVEFECERCSHQWESKLDIQPSFFFPSAK